MTLHKRIHDGVWAKLTALNLVIDGLVGGIINETVMDETNIEMPCVIVSIDGEQEEMLGGTTLTKHKKYPVRVFVLSRDNEFPNDEEKLLGWRERMIAAVDNPARDTTSGLILPGCPEVCNTEVLPKVIFDERLPQYKYVVSGFVVKAEAFVNRV